MYSRIDSMEANVERAIDENENGMTSEDRMRRCIAHAIRLLQENGSDDKVFKAMGKATNKTVTIMESNVESNGAIPKKRVNSEPLEIDPSILYGIRDPKKKMKVNEDDGKYDRLMDCCNDTEDANSGAKPTKVQGNSKRYKEVLEALSKPVSSYTLLYEPNLVPTSKKTPRKKASCKSTDPTPVKKMCKSKLESVNEAKMKGTPTKKCESFPSNVRILTATGMLDGVGVKYLSASREYELRGVIKGTSYLCGCKSCNYANALSADQFEDHAGCKTSHPNNHIYLENASDHPKSKAKSLHKIVQELKNTPTNMLCAAVQALLGSVLNQEAFSSWKASVSREENS